MLSPEQSHVLAALVFVTRDGWPASVKEVAAEAKLASSTVHVHLHALEREGKAESHPRRDRGGWLPW